MHNLNVVIIASTFIFSCTQIVGCTTSGDIQLVEHPPLSESEVAALHKRANEILVPIRSSSGCYLGIRFLGRSLESYLPNSAHYPKFHVWLAEENGNCSNAVVELNRVGKLHEFSFGVMKDVESPVTNRNSDAPTDYTLIHEIDP